VKVRKPRAAEIRQLHAAQEHDLTARQRRRAEVLMLYAAGMEAATIAQALDSHVNTIYSDLRAFERDGVDCIRQRLRGGAPARLTEIQRADILRLADMPPSNVGLPYGRWSLSKLREYLLTHRIVKAISREHLRRVLKKGGSAFVMSNPN
jgi:transposase